MTTNLRWENSDWPLFRVLYATTFAADGSGPWTEAPYVADGVNGIWFQDCERGVLPTIGRATLIMEYGEIDGEDVTPLDLLDKHIRIQAARWPTDETATPEWRTIWVGRCEWQDDDLHAGAITPAGRRTYHCVDLLYAYTRGYPLDRHANYKLTGALAYGHPGYNYTKDAPRAVVGNKESTDAAYSGPDSTSIIFIAVSDAAGTTSVVPWTDAEAVDNVLLLRRNAGDPIFDLDHNPSGAAASLLSGETPWPVNEGETAWTFINRVLDRRRGKGLAYLDWEDDSATPTGALDVKLRVRPQLASTLTYTWTGGTITVPGADTIEGLLAHVDLTGDQRIVDDAFSIRQATDSAVDLLVTEGEPVQVAVTLSGSDSTLAERWSSALETAWSAASADVQAEARFRPVLQYFGPLRTAGTVYKDGDGGAGQRGDYWSYGSDGALSITHTTVTAPEHIKIMDDLPLYEGWDYSVTPPVPLSGADEDGVYPRRKPAVYVKTTTGRFLSADDYIEGGAQVSVDDDGIWVEWAGDQDGLRSIRSTWPGVSDRTITESSLTVTVGLRMPQRPTFDSNISGTVRRRKTIRIPDCHLWIAHAGCIYDLDRSTENADGYTPKRIGGTIEGSITGRIIRDDRAVLAYIHALAWEWYRSDAGRLAVQWGLRDCALLPSYQDVSGTTRVYPKLGQIITIFTAGGTSYQPETPITRVTYDNRSGITTWATDWTEYDYGSA